MKILDGRELAGFVKERQAKMVRTLRAERRLPKLLILRDNQNPVIEKYVQLKRRYGEDIGVAVEDFLAGNTAELAKRVEAAGQDPCVSGMIIQLPLQDSEQTDALVAKIEPKKDVDGMTGRGRFVSATATAINWLLAGYDIALDGKKIALVGQGRLVGAPLAKIWQDSGYDVRGFHRGDDLTKLNKYDVVVSATGVPGLIKTEMIKPGAVVVDAGTASDGGVLVGDVAEEVREREDLLAMTPKIGGVGPLTVAVLFENALAAVS